MRWISILTAALAGGDSAGGGRFDFAFSLDAFGRLASREKMESCLREVHRVLRPGALFKFRAPGWDSAAAVLAERCGFAMRHQERAGERDCWVWLFKHPEAGQTAWPDQNLDHIGELTVEHYIRTDLTNVCQGKEPGDMRVLFETGRGEKGITRALAGLFGEVCAMDAASVSGAVGGWWARLGFGRKRPADFAFAYSAFQQMASREGIESAVRAIHRRLRPGALFKLRVRGSGAGERHSASRRQERWPGAAGSKCGTTTARASRTTGCGSSRKRR